MEKAAVGREEERQQKGEGGQRRTKDREQDGDAGKTWDGQHNKGGVKKNRVRERKEKKKVKNTER